MPQLLLTLFEMLAAGGIVVVAGIYLAKFGDAIGARTGIGGVWIGGILLAAPHFAETAKRAARLTGMGDTFIGTWLVGTSTSLPEFAASLAAVRIHAFDMAVGNLFGSNAFNMTLFAALDWANSGTPVLSVADPAHMITALVAIILTATAMSAIVFRAERSLTLLEPSSALMLALYVFGLLLVYRHAVHGTIR
jgi:cation:H+ antiporter